jgi:hypothetical protein
MLLNKSQFLLGMFTFGVLSASHPFTSSASAVSFLGTVGAPINATVNGVTFSNFSTTSTDVRWLSYFLVGTETPIGAQLGIATNATAVTAGSYDLSYTVTSTVPINSISVNQSASSTITVKNVSATPGGTNIPGFPITTTDSTVAGSVVPNLTTVYVKDSITVTSNGFVTSVTNIFTAVPEPLTILGAMTAAGFGVGFKRKLAKAGQEESKKA